MNVVIRSDASHDLGSGHVMRCLSLAEALKNRGTSVHFVCRQLTGHLCDLIEKRGFQAHRLPVAGNVRAGKTPSQLPSLTADWQEDARHTSGVIAGLGLRPDWLVVDNYALDVRWEQLLRGAVDKVFVIDDLADRRHECDLLLDQNLFADADVRYVGKIPGRCRVLLGPRYALLKAEFAQTRAHTQPRTGAVNRILVFVGGADGKGRTLAAIQALSMLKLSDVEVDVCVGAQQSNADQIAKACETQGFRIHVQTNDMAELMGAADLAVGAGGTANWERCCVGLPCITLSLAPNQRQVIHDAGVAGLLYAPDIDADDPDALARHLQTCIDNPLLLSALSRNAMGAVDGRGCPRVLRAMGVIAVSIREAESTDCEQVFEWRNDPGIRGTARDRTMLQWPAHQAWFEATLADPDRRLLIGESGGKPVGVVRFDMSGGSAEVSIYMVPGCGGGGLGADLMQAAEQWLAMARPDIHRLNGEVLDANLASHRLFATLGYAASSTQYSKRL